MVAHVEPVFMDAVVPTVQNCGTVNDAQRIEAHATHLREVFGQLGAAARPVIAFKEAIHALVVDALGGKEHAVQSRRAAFTAHDLHTVIQHARIELLSSQHELAAFKRNEAGLAPTAVHKRYHCGDDACSSW
jgi:hypothetical protein